jgi:hypothetical protein
VFVWRDQQQHAVVLRLLAKLPGAEQLVGVRFYLLPLERVYGGNDELDAGFGFEFRKLRGKRIALPGGEDVASSTTRSVSGGKVMAQTASAA